jgi:hypothetical protein
MAVDNGPSISVFDMAGLPTAVPRVKSRRLLWTANARLSLAVVGLGAGFAYSTNSAGAWHDTAFRSATDLGVAQGGNDAFVYIRVG